MSVVACDAAPLSLLIQNQKCANEIRPTGGLRASRTQEPTSQGLGARRDQSHQLPFVFLN